MNTVVTQQIIAYPTIDFTNFYIPFMIIKGKTNILHLLNFQLTVNCNKEYERDKNQNS